MIKDYIATLNNGMSNGEISFDFVRKLLAHLSLVTGKDYDILNKRVVYRDGRDMHDAWVNA